MTTDIHDDHQPAPPMGVSSSEGLGPAVPKRKDLGDLIDELVDASVSLELAQRPQSIQINSFKVERIEDELRERLEEVRLMMQTVDNLEARIAMERQAQRDACASAAWIHYMDVCKARGLAPSEHEHWNAARSVRGA